MNRRQLTNAVRTGSPESIVGLFRRQNDPRDQDGQTLLHYVIDLGDRAVEVIEALATAGADLDAADNRGISPLHCAARDENYAAFAVLVECGANPFLPDVRGRTPLQMLNRSGRYPHDAIARFTFGHPVMARGLLRTILPTRMVPDEAAIRRIDGELVSHALSRTLRSDMILVLERPDIRPVAVIVEFQSGVDREMAERIASYRTELARTIRRNHAELVGADGRIPFIVSAVVHTGTDPWNAAGDADSLTDPPEHPDLEFHRLHARYAVQDVQRTDYSRYEDNPAAAYFRLYRGDRADMLRAAKELDKLLPLDKYRPLLHLLVTTAALGSRYFPEAALEGAPLMTGFAQHYDAAVERAEASMASNRELMADLAAERFGAETGERLKSMLDGIVDLEELQEAKTHVRASRTAEELFAYFDRRH